MTLQQKRLLCFLLSLFAGFVLWEHAPRWLGRANPWNAYGWHYLLGLFAVGLVVRALTMGKPDVIYWGVILGQWFGILWPSLAVMPMVSIDALMVLLVSLAAYFGAWLMMHVR